ncbi:MAG TPA: thermonuclease family protein [Xanthobacteraceae bacterium]|nr:thermonuclease family protein [Xanthobacteraceae bacterium]
MHLGQYSLCSVLSLAGVAAAWLFAAPGTPSRPAASQALASQAGGAAARTAEAALASYPAEVVAVTDGDTFAARVHVWPGIEVSTKVRLRGIDTPELRARCEREKILAALARERLTAILAEGAVRLSDVSPDKYGGRVVASAATGRTPDVGDALLALGVARPYTGGRRGSWCDAT